jgi:hypothetical protein
MRESRTSGSVRGGRGNPVPYRYTLALCNEFGTPGAFRPRGQYEKANRAQNAPLTTPPTFASRACRNVPPGNVGWLTHKWSTAVS